MATKEPFKIVGWGLLPIPGEGRLWKKARQEAGELLDFAESADKSGRSESEGRDSAGKAGLQARDDDHRPTRQQDPPHAAAASAVQSPAEGRSPRAPQAAGHSRDPRQREIDQLTLLWNLPAVDARNRNNIAALGTTKIVKPA